MNDYDVVRLGSHSAERVTAPKRHLRMASESSAPVGPIQASLQLQKAVKALELAEAAQTERRKTIRTIENSM